MRLIAVLLFLGFAALRCFAATSAEAEKERLRQMVAEVDARRVVREHESGKKKATEAHLAAAQAVIRQSDERKARRAAPGPNGGFSLTMKDVNMVAVAEKWQEIFGGIASAADRIRSKQISISISASSLEEFRKNAEAALRQNGVYLIYRPDGLLLDLEPESYRRK